MISEFFVDLQTWAMCLQPRCCPLPDPRSWLRGIPVHARLQVMRHCAGHSTGQDSFVLPCPLIRCHSCRLCSRTLLRVAQQRFHHFEVYRVLARWPSLQPPRCLTMCSLILHHHKAQQSRKRFQQGSRKWRKMKKKMKKKNNKKWNKKQEEKWKKKWKKNSKS